MSKFVYQNPNADALKHFNLEQEPTIGFFAHDGEAIVTQDFTLFDRIVELFRKETADTTKLSDYKKAFIIPGCSVTSERIRETAREHKIVITNDYNQADLIISDAINVSARRHNNDPLGQNTLFLQIWGYTAYDHPTKDSKFIWDHNCDYSYYSLSGEEDMHDVRLISGLGLNLAYLIDSNNVDVVEIDSFMNSSANIMDLNEDTLTQITNLASSYDKADKEMLRALLITVNYKNKPHLFWRLCQDVYPHLHIGRNKDLQYWYEKSDMQDTYYRNAEEQIQHLEEQGTLDGESFRYLEKIARQEIEISNRNLYVFKVQVKKEYRKFLL